MTRTVPVPPAWHARLGRLFALAFILALLAVTMLAGWVTIEEATHRFMLPFTTDRAAAQIEAAAQLVRAAPSSANLYPLSVELWGMSHFVAARHWTESALIEQGVYYATMPRFNQAAMLLHVLFSAFCMLAGGLQFWPAFRKRFMRVHRTIGAAYIVTVPLGVTAALCYLAVTPPYRIYDNLVAWIALWVFGLLALLSVGMAVHALRQRRIFEHQAWMALSFSSLLVAPLLRWDWVWLALLLPGIDQETLNLVTMGIMLPECLLIAYALISINRQFARPMRQRAASRLATLGAAGYRHARPLILLAGLALLGADLAFYWNGHGMSALANASRRVPLALIQREHTILSAHWFAARVFALSLGLAFPLCANLLRRLLAANGTQSEHAWLDYAGPLLALTAGAASCFLGARIGLAPNRLWLSGGVMYFVNGLVLMAFSGLFLAARRAGQGALVKESLVFMLCMLPFPALFLLALQVLAWLPLPAVYVAAGQGYVLPAGFSGALLFLALFHVVFGEATREHN